MSEERVKPNFEKINYSLRPAKNVERKMICEAIGRLSHFENIRNYRYIGFGSAYFSDFSLFHKTLGINKLLSIEKEKSYEQRIDFNKPFSCIDVVYGESSEVLPSLPWSEWNEKSIVWLDYTGKLDLEMLGDIDTVFSQVKPGSLFLISVNIAQESKPDSYKGTAKEYRLKKLQERLSVKEIPPRALEMNLSTETNKSIIWEIIDNTIRNSIHTRNGGLSEEEKLVYNQIFNFYYNDRSDMLTVGGIVRNLKQGNKMIEMELDNLEFIRRNSDCFEIIVPNLTFREIHALDKLLPNTDNLKEGKISEEKKQLPLEVDDIKNYASIYRYFPTFTEANL